MQNRPSIYVQNVKHTDDEDEWIECGKCLNWSHLMCTGLKGLTPEEPPACMTNELQLKDPELEPYFTYLEQKVLPDDKNAKRMGEIMAEQCQRCKACQSRHAGPAVTAPMNPIPIGGPFECVAVEVLQLPKS